MNVVTSWNLFCYITENNRNNLYCYINVGICEWKYTTHVVLTILGILKLGLSNTLYDFGCIFVTGWKVNCNPVDIKSEHRECWTGKWQHHKTWPSEVRIDSDPEHRESVEQENDSSTDGTPSEVRVDSEPEHSESVEQENDNSKEGTPCDVRVDSEPEHGESVEQENDSSTEGTPS